MKIRSVGAELFHEGRRKDGHDEANRRFSQFYEKLLKLTNFTIFHPDCYKTNQTNSEYESRTRCSLNTAL